MLRLYSVPRTERILRSLEPELRAISGQYGIPPAYILAVLRKEIAEIDLGDPLADLAVRFYWARYGLRKALCRAGILRSPVPRIRRGVFGKRDSSTGYAQIFAFVGINAVNYALDRGLDTPAGLGVPGERRLRPDEAEDLRRIWFRLQRDRLFNARLAILNLISAGEEMNGHADFSRYGPEEIQRTLTRYNADVRHVTAYGREVYRYYTEFAAM